MLIALWHESECGAELGYVISDDVRFAASLHLVPEPHSGLL
jgi:hypothetical protein